ncbi:MULTISPECIES: SAM-dependent methyltransferase [unclassified Nitrospina]|uniref:SAM-dependent methyltransferase n=1 Tax=unclassified Nitrospina TaxID=2638683 RepID=UPI003F9D0041
MESLINLMERGLVPDLLTRWGIRCLATQRLRDESNNYIHDESFSKERFASQMKSGPIALHTDEANAQHYELPPQFFEKVLGDHRKYSGCFWEENTETLTEAEAASLAISCDRASIENGMDILELGCGWGSLSLWIAEQYPNCKVTAVSNSRVQRDYIVGICESKGKNNLEIITCDMNTFAPYGHFDRIVSIEMFEHMRNYHCLMKQIASWLKPDGKLFFHIFCHKRFPYFFETEGDDNWMGRYFFTGGVMPSFDLPGYFQEDLNMESKWWWGGQHYQKTAEAWLHNMDEQKAEILDLFSQIYGDHDSKIWFHRWRIFFMACAELFGYKNGSEWGVSHYLFNKNTMGREYNEN